jgi:PBP1b-binding outer membrane lipoprotein LpoB
VKTARIVGLIIGCLLVLVGCATRPSHQELTDAILTATEAEPDIDLSAEEAACIATALLASDLSDTTLSGLAEDFDSPQVLEEELELVEPLVSEAANACR